MAIVSSTIPIINLGLARDTIAADVGAYYTASTVPGTGLLGHAVSTTLVETKAIFVCANTGSLSVYPQYLRMTMTVLPVGNTQQQFTVTLDQGNRFSAFVAGNALTPVNVNNASLNTSGAAISAGAVTLTANTSQRRIIGHRQFRPTVIGVVGDVYQWSWGSSSVVDPSGLPTDGTSRAHIYYNSSPLVISPGTMMAIHAWGATFSTGATYEYEFGYVEK